MRTLMFAWIPTLLLACGDDTTATASLSGTDTSTSGDPSTDPSVPSTGTSSTDVASDTPGTITATVTAPTTSGSTTDPTATTATVTTSGETDSTSVDPSGSTTTGDTTTDTTTTDTTTGDTTTGVILGCGMDGPEIEANLVRVDEPPPPCGALEFKGQNQADSPGPIYMLDGCPCGANCLKPEPWTFTIDAPKDWLPGKLPKCPRIVVERQMGKAGCELVGVSIWDAQADKSPALYHAGSLLGPIAAAKSELMTASIVAEECDCDNCCSSPTRLDLKFTALGGSAIVSEGASDELGNADLAYQVMNFQSHLSGICDDAPAIDWAMRLVVKP